MQPVGSHAGLEQGRFSGLDHGLRTTDEDLVHAGHRQQRGDQCAHLVAVDAPFEQRHLLRLARQDVDQCETSCVAVFQVLQCLVEHHTVHAAVAVHQGEFGVGRFFERAGHEREDGRDARTRRKAHTVQGARFVHREAAIGRHDLERVTCPEFAGSPVGKHTTFHRADAQREFAALLEQAARAADGIAAPHILPADGGAHGEELARFERECRALFGRDGQGDGHSTCGFGADAGDGQLVEAGSGIHGINRV